MTATSGAALADGRRRCAARSPRRSSSGSWRARPRGPLAGPSHARDELGDLQVLGIDAVDRRQRASEHVVAAAVLVRALDRDHVAGLLDDADHAASRRSSRQIGQRGPSARLKHTSHSPMRSFTSRIASASAKCLLRARPAGCGRRAAAPCAGRCRGACASSVIRRWTGGATRVRAAHCAAEPARGAVRRRAGSRPPPPPPSRRGRPARRGRRARRSGRPPAPAIALSRFSSAEAQRLVDRREDHVLQHLEVFGVDRLGVDGDRPRRSPVTLTLTMPPPAEASTSSSLSCSCACSMSCLHLLDLASILLMFGGCGIDGSSLRRRRRARGQLLGIELCHEARDELVLRQVAAGCRLVAGPVDLGRRGAACAR